MKIAEIKNVKKTYLSKTYLWSRATKKQALNGVSFDIEKGEIFGLLGPNGAGKSTIINILMGLLSPDSGEIRIFGDDFFTHDEEIRNRMNISTAYSQLPWDLTVEENLKVFAAFYNVNHPQKKIDSLLSDLNALDLRHKCVRTLSSGQKARINLCKCLINDPELLLLDEPTASLDPESAAHIRELLLKIKKKRKMTILFTSHNMFEVEELCDRVAFLSKGKIFAIDTPDNLVKIIPYEYIKVYVKAHFECPDALKNHNEYRLLEQSKHELVFQIPHATGEKLSFLKWLEEKNIPCIDIEIESPNLESVFLEIAGKNN